MIILENISKRYHTNHGPGKWVLEDVSFTIPRNVSVGIVGGNGAGKSTLLRIIGGIDQPSRGRIERHCRMSWPIGSANMQPSLTGRQNAKFLCRVHGHEDDIPERLAFIQDFAEIGSLFDEPVKTYSPGMKSRLQFGISLAFKFEVYISDEATSAGDASFRQKAADAFKNMIGQASLVMAAHGEGALKEFCTSGIFLNKGRAVWFDDLDDALSAYKDSIKK